MRIIIPALINAILTATLGVLLYQKALSEGSTLLRKPDILLLGALLLASALWLIIEGMASKRRYNEANYQLQEKLRQAAAGQADLQKSLTLEKEQRARELANAAARERDLGNQLKAMDRQTSAIEVIHLLTHLQQKGRLLDFVMDDITRYSDQQVGAAARVVHQGCKQVLQEYFEIHLAPPLNS